MRANRMICELRRQDLAMTRGEAATLLRSTGLALDADDVGRLMERTEGWPAGLYLAALSLQAQPDLERALARFAGDDRIVADYLRDELLAQLPEERLLFLARTSVLDTLSGGLCDAVLDRPGSGRVLKDLARSNILLVPLDRTDERFRYHGLFAEMLKAELRRLEPENEPELHRRAGAWHAERGEIDLAIEHAVAAGDVENAGELLWSIAADYLSHGRNAAIRRWLDQFTGEQIAACAPLALTAAASDLAAGRCDWVEHWASAAERCLDRSSAPAGAGPVATGAAVMRAAVGREGIASMEEDAARACEGLPDDSPWRSLCCLLMGVAAHLSGDREGASERLDEGARRAAVAAPSVRVLCFAQLALIALEREDWELGGAFAGRARSQTIHGALSDYPTSALVFAVSALVRAHLGHVDEAQQDMRHAKDLLARLESFAPWYEVEARIALARASLRLSDVVGARTLLAEASRINRGRGEAIVLTEWLDDAWGQANEFIAASVVGPTSLTTAELRVLRLLPTHLSFREIAGRLNVSANTIKTQAHAVYRKLDASSRSDAVTHARSVGLLDA
jgi:LuxR family maltose regulon positive regulatory protein